MPICPICKSEVKPLDLTGDTVGFDCPKHGCFRVSGTVFADARTKNAEPQQWEAALKRAQARGKLDEWPMVVTHDFGV